MEKQKGLQKGDSKLGTEESITAKKKYIYVYILFMILNHSSV